MNEMISMVLGGKDVDIETSGSRVVFSLSDGSDPYGDFCCAVMSKQECQQLIEQLMLVCERLQE